MYLIVKCVQLVKYTVLIISIIMSSWKNKTVKPQKNKFLSVNTLQDVFVLFRSTSLHSWQFCWVLTERDRNKWWIHKNKWQTCVGRSERENPLLRIPLEASCTTYLSLTPAKFQEKPTSYASYSSTAFHKILNKSFLASDWPVFVISIWSKLAFANNLY